MTEPKRDEPLEYQTPTGPSKVKVGSCTGMAVVFAALVGLLLVLVIAFVPNWVRAVLVVALVGSIIIAILRRRPDAMYPAIAITMVAGAMFVLMLGLCAVAAG